MAHLLKRRLLLLLGTAPHLPSFTALATSGRQVTMSSTADLPTTMQCVKYGDLASVVTDQPVPKPKPGHILVKVKVAGLNPVDAKNVLGDKLPHTWKNAHALLQRYIRESIPGFDFAGVCVQSSTDAYKPGDRVFGTIPPFGGSVAEYVSAPLDQVAHMSSKMTFEQAGALPLVG